MPDTKEMYNPARFKNENTEKSFEVIRKNPFATLITCHDSGPFISHLPLILEIEEDRLVLYGHLARGNPHADLLASAMVTAVFLGPHAYITPTWYEQNDVPTWNYITVHVQGRCQMITDRNGIVECLKKLTNEMEKDRAQSWDFWIPNDLAADGELEKYIVGFKVEIENMQAKFKLSQNRSEADKAGVVAGLLGIGGDFNRAIAQEMTALR